MGDRVQVGVITSIENTESWEALSLSPWDAMALGVTMEPTPRDHAPEPVKPTPSLTYRPMYHYERERYAQQSNSNAGSDADVSPWAWGIRAREGR